MPDFVVFIYSVISIRLLLNVCNPLVAFAITVTIVLLTKTIAGYL